MDWVKGDGPLSRSASSEFSNPDIKKVSKCVVDVHKINKRFLQILWLPAALH